MDAVCQRFRLLIVAVATGQPSRRSRVYAGGAARRACSTRQDRGMARGPAHGPTETLLYIMCIIGVSLITRRVGFS